MQTFFIIKNKTRAVESVICLFLNQNSNVTMPFHSFESQFLS